MNRILNLVLGNQTHPCFPFQVLSQLRLPELPIVERAHTRALYHPAGSLRNVHRTQTDVNAGGHTLSAGAKAGRLPAHPLPGSVDFTPGFSV